LCREAAREKRRDMSTYTNILLHVIFSTKGRLPLITPEFRPRLHEYLGGAVRGEGGVPYEVGGTADHVHILLRWNSTETIADLLREIKSGTSKWANRELRTRSKFAWQKGYGAFSVSHSQKGKVAAYIRKQEEHHAVVSFQDEFRKFLKMNEIEYDENYVWD